MMQEKNYSYFNDLDWQESIGTKPKLRTYVKFKCHIFNEDYASQNLKKYERSLVAKLTSGILPPAVEM